MERINKIKTTAIPENSITQKLTALYEKNRDKYEDISRIFSDYPLANTYMLTASTEYCEAKVKVMVCGKETNSWGGEFGGHGTASVQDLQQLFTLYIWEEHGKGPFHSFIKRLNTIDGVTVLPNNIVKIGKKGKAGHYSAIARFCNEELPLLREEIAITTPDLIVCPTSNYDQYNICLSAQLGNHTEERLGEHIYLRHYESIPDTPVIICPHPQGKAREDLDVIKDTIENYICKRFNSSIHSSRLP